MGELLRDGRDHIGDGTSVTLRAGASREDAAGDGGAAGDAIPPHAYVIEVRVPDLARLFNAIDPSPLYDRDLDADMEEFIVGWAREAPGGEPLALLVHVDRAALSPHEAGLVRDSIHAFFGNRAVRSRRQFRALMRVGRTSLMIGIAVLAGFVAIGDLIAWRAHGSRMAEVVRESLMIGGWVAMWRPLEIFLYEWWPIRAETRLLDRLAVMPVRIRNHDGDPAAVRME